MTNLTFTSAQYDQLQTHLFPGDGLEALAICLATPIAHEDGIRLIVTDVFCVPHELCQRREDLLIWRTADIIDILDQASNQKKSVIKIHSHPGGYEAFSAQDDRSDFGLFPSIYNWCESAAPHASVIFTPNSIIGRLIDRGNEAQFIDNVWVVGPTLRLFPYRPESKVLGFDESTYEVFKKIKIGLVGCSGTGTWISELCGRNEFGVFCICEFDSLEKVNLNRLLNSKLSLIGKNKAEIAKDSVLDMGLGSIVRISKSPLQTEESINLLKSCDILIGCLDSVFARHLLNLLSTYYVIPYFDIGVHIHAANGKIQNAVSGWEYLAPGYSSLQTRGVITAEALAEETYRLFSPQHFGRLEKEGYVRGDRKVSRPAVSAINGKASLSCFEEVQARLLRYRYDPDDQVASKVFCAKGDEEFRKYESDLKTDLLLKKKVGLTDQFFAENSHLLRQNKPQEPDIVADAIA